MATGLKLCCHILERFRRPASDNVQKTSSKHARASKSSENRSRKLRCRINIIPIKSLLLAMSFLINANVEKFYNNDDVYPAMKRITKHMQTLKETANELYRDIEVSPDTLYNELKLGVTSYVNFFYNISKKSRDTYIDTLKEDASISGRHSEINMLSAPALMANRAIKKSDAISAMLSELYSKPLKFCHSSGKAAMQIEFFKKSMAIRAMPEESFGRLSDALGRLDEAIKAINNYSFEPINTEKEKSEFFESMIKLDNESGFGITGFIEDRLMPYEIPSHKIMRR